MKKLYTLIALGLFAVSTQAQVKLGFRGGANLSNVSLQDDQPTVNTKFKFGATGGIFVNIPISTSFSVQPELLYSSQGFKVKENFPEGNINYEYNLKSHTDNLVLPVIFKYRLANGIVFELGPQASYYLQGKYDVYVHKKNSEGIISTDSFRMDPDFIKEFSFAGVAGIGYELKDGYSINARYTHGFSTTYDFSPKGKDYYFSLTVGIPFIK